MSTDPRTFGGYVRRVRAVKRIGLREFVMSAGYDPSNWSRIERGLSPAPTDWYRLNQIADHLRMEPGSNERFRLIDLAYAEHRMIPPDIVRDEALLEILPELFQRMRVVNQENGN